MIIIIINHNQCPIESKTILQVEMMEEYFEPLGSGNDNPPEKTSKNHDQMTLFIVSHLLQLGKTLWVQI